MPAGKTLWACIGLLGMGLLLSLFTPLTLPATGSARPWKGARLLAVDSNLDEIKVRDCLQKAGIAHVASRGSQEVEISLFDELEEIGLKDISNRLVDADPRWTFYLRGLEGLFSASKGGLSYDLYYLLNEERSSLGLEKSLARSLPADARWELLERGLRGSYLRGSILFLMLILSLFFILPQRERSILILSISFYPVFFSDSLSFIAASLPLLFLFILIFRAYIRYPYDKSHIVKSIPLIFLQGGRGRSILLLSILSIPAFFLLPLLSILLVFASSSGFLLSLILRERLRLHGTRHRLFTPIALRPSSYAPAFDGSGLAVFLLSSCLALLLIRFFMPSSLQGGSSSLLSFPHPQGYTREDTEAPRLPNYADFEEHLREQAGLPYRDLRSQDARDFTDYLQRDDGSLAQSRSRQRPLAKVQGAEIGIELVLKASGDNALIAKGTWEARGSATEAGIGFALSSLGIGSILFLLLGVRRGTKIKNQTCPEAGILSAARG